MPANAKSRGDKGRSQPGGKPYNPDPVARLLPLAQTSKVDAFADTGAADNGIFTTSNGADWFYAANWSCGFKPLGAGFTKFECMFGPPDSSMCVHTLDGIGGFSINMIDGLIFSSDYEKLVFVVVPESGTSSMLIAGFGLVGFAARRRAAIA